MAGCIQVSSIREGDIELESRRQGKILVSSSYVCDVIPAPPMVVIKRNGIVITFNRRAIGYYVEE